jgi:hypothetical protein
MAKQTNDYKPTGFNIAAVNLTAADTTVPKLIIAAGANDSVINQFTIRNAHTVSATVEILLYNGSSDFILTTVVVPASAGNLGTTVAFDVLGLACIYNALINLELGWSIRARAKTTLANDLTFIVIATDY